jgi:hypothetical protein
VYTITITNNPSKQLKPVSNFSIRWLDLWLHPPKDVPNLFFN